MRIKAVAIILLLAGSVLGGATASDEAVPPAVSPAEAINFTWRIEGLKGLVARIFNLVPTAGEGVLEVFSADAGRLVCRFRATSHQESAEDHWTYHAEVNLDEERTERVWDSWNFRGRHREKEYDLSSESAIDIVSGLHLLRLAPPTEPGRITAWSGGKVYPILVTPRGLEQREIHGRLLLVRHFSVTGIREPGQYFFKPQGDIWLEDSDEAIPVEILYRRRGLRLRLTLDETADR